MYGHLPLFWGMEMMGDESPGQSPLIERGFER